MVEKAKVSSGILSLDITECKLAEEQLRESEEKFRTIFDNVNDGIIHLDKYGKVININKKAEAIFGYKRDDLIGRNFAKLGIFNLKDLLLELKRPEV